jgi:hypothetical protein
MKQAAEEAEREAQIKRSDPDAESGKPGAE